MKRLKIDPYLSEKNLKNVLYEMFDVEPNPQHKIKYF
jgi:hypothetical protein